MAGYFFVWFDIGLLVAILFALIHRIPFGQALMFATPLTLVFGVISLSAFWVCRAAPLGQSSAMRVGSVALIGSLQAAIVWVAIAWGWGMLLVRGQLPVFRGVVWPSYATDPTVVLGTLLVVGILLYLMSVVLNYLLIAFENARRSERKALDAQVAAREAEVRALRAQLNPHFLFNSLNSINALIGGKPEDARRMCSTLGDFLRRTLALSRRETVPLADELELVERYLSIERVRFGDRLRVEYDSSPEARRCLVPSLLLQPLVENAIKHGIADRIDTGRIAVKAHRVEDELEIQVTNDFDEDAGSKPGEAVGIENVRRRLAAFAARETRLDVGAADGVFRVTLRLPAREASEEIERASA